MKHLFRLCNIDGMGHQHNLVIIHTYVKKPGSKKANDLELREFFKSESTENRVRVPWESFS